jgi:hypothetical protein
VAPSPRSNRSRAASTTQPAPSKVDSPAPVTNTALRRRVHEALYANVAPGDRRDLTELLDLAGDVLDLDDMERITAQSYVRSWKQDADTNPGRRSPATAVM